MTIQVTQERKRILTPEVQEQLELSAEERINIIKKGIWVQYPLANKLMKFLEDLSTQPKRPRMEGRTIIGPTNNGKTSIIQEFIDIQRQKRGYSDDSVYEYIYVEAPEIPSVKSLYIEILSACNISVKAGTAEQLKQKVLQVLRNLNVKMLFLDEIHNFLNAQNERIMSQCRNALKGLSNRLQIPIILIGTEDAEEVLKGDSQVLNRYKIIRLHEWKKDQNFLLLLQAFEQALPLKKASNLYKKEISSKIYDLSKGILGTIATLLQESAIEAILTGTERITLEIINKLHDDKFAKF